MEITRCRDFTREQDYGAFAAVRAFNGCLKQLGGRHAWVTLSSGNMKLYRRVMGAAGTGLSHGDIEFDYDSRLELGLSGHPDENGFYGCDLTMQPSSFIERLHAHWRHPNLAYRVPYQLAILSLVLGAVGLVLGIVNVIK